MAKRAIRLAGSKVIKKHRAAVVAARKKMKKSKKKYHVNYQKAFKYIHIF